MQNRNNGYQYQLSLFVAFLIAATAPASYGCWQESGDDFDCAGNDICLVWDESGLPVKSDEVAFECCSQPGAPCENPCSSGIRPVGFRVDLLPENPLKAFVDYRHTSPKIPLMVDGEYFAPGDIGRFDGSPLYFLACRSLAGDFSFSASTTREGLVDQLHQCGLGNPSFVVPEAPEQAASGIMLYENSKWGGASYFLPSGQSVAFSETWWNDQVTSLRGFGAGTIVTLFENSDLTGSSLTMTSNLGLPNLGTFGWNSRVSSVVAWPLAPIYHKPLQGLDMSK